MVLVHWTYTNHEWNTFLVKKLWRGEWVIVLRNIFSMGKKHSPEVRITPERVFIGSRPTLISSGKHRIRKISIKEAGKINMMEIIYEVAGKQKARHIQIPVPKGKLVEAFEVEERLLTIW